MGKFYSSLKTLRPVQILVLVFALLASGAATYAGYELSSRSPSSGLGEDQQLIPIGFGDLVRQVTTSGSLEFPERETMSFGTARTRGPTASTVASRPGLATHGVFGREGW